MNNGQITIENYNVEQPSLLNIVQFHHDAISDGQSYLKDEVHFFMNGYINKQNAAFGVITFYMRPHQLQMHPEKVPDWCLFSNGGIIGDNFVIDIPIHPKIEFRH